MALERRRGGGVNAGKQCKVRIEKCDFHQYAVFKAIEILGEAARLVSDETRKAHPQIPWESIAGMRNRLIHEYFRIHLATVWQTVQEDIPPLVAQLKPLVPPEAP